MNLLLPGDISHLIHCLTVPLLPSSNNKINNNFTNFKHGHPSPKKVSPHDTFSQILLSAFQMARVIGKKVKMVTVNNKNRKGCTLNQWDPARLPDICLCNVDLGIFQARDNCRRLSLPVANSFAADCVVTQPGHASGRPTALTPQVEHDLAKYLRNLSRRGFPLQALTVLSTAN